MTFASASRLSPPMPLCMFVGSFPLRVGPPTWLAAYLLTFGNTMTFGFACRFPVLAFLIGGERVRRRAVGVEPGAPPALVLRSAVDVADARDVEVADPAGAAGDAPTPPRPSAPRAAAPGSRAPRSGSTIEYLLGPFAVVIPRNRARPRRLHVRVPETEQGEAARPPCARRREKRPRTVGALPPRAVASPPSGVISRFRMLASLSGDNDVPEQRKRPRRCRHRPRAPAGIRRMAN